MLSISTWMMMTIDLFILIGSLFNLIINNNLPQFLVSIKMENWISNS